MPPAVPRLLAVLATDVVLRADALAVQTATERQQRGAPSLAPEIRTAPLVADAFKGCARGAASATIDGEAGAVWAAGGQVRAAFMFTIELGKIASIDLIMEPVQLAELAVEFDGARSSAPSATERGSPPRSSDASTAARGSLRS